MLQGGVVLRSRSDAACQPSSRARDLAVQCSSSRRAVWAAIVLAGTIGSGCGASPPSGPAAPGRTGPAPARPSTPADLGPLAPLARAPVAPVISERFGVTLPLPDPNGWQIVPERSSFLVLEHRTSSSRLVVRLWREADIMNRDRCEQQARALRRDLPDHDSGGGLSRRRIDVPPEFDTLVEVGLGRTSPAEPVEGHVMAFGGWVRRCFAFVYTTSGAGPDAERVIGDRLAVMEARALEGLELRSSTSPTTTTRAIDGTRR